MPYPLDEILDLERYPLHDATQAGYGELVEEKAADWETAGICALPGLIKPRMARLASEELRKPMEERSFRHQSDHNIYFSDTTDSLPPDLAERRLRTSHRTLTCDQIPGSIIRQVYEWNPLRAFIQAVLKVPALYRMADPMACLNVMAYGAGDELGWHFDRAGFAVTILLQAADDGGQFEYRRNLRSKDDPNYPGIRRFLAGQDNLIRQSVAQPGAMTLFAGYSAAHRVAPVRGHKARLMAVLGYMQEPNFLLGEAERRRFYGRTSVEA